MRMRQYPNLRMSDRAADLRLVTRYSNWRYLTENALPLMTRQIHQYLKRQARLIQDGYAMASA